MECQYIIVELLKIIISDNSLMVKTQHTSKLTQVGPSWDIIVSHV